MPKYLVELDDGRKFEVEAEQQPTAEDLLPMIPAAPEKPFVDVSDTLSATGRAFTSLGTTVPASLSQAWSGLENPWKRSEGYLQRQQEMRALQEEMAAAEEGAAKAGDASSVSSAIREATPSLGFSGATLVPSLAAGAGTALATRSPALSRMAAAGTSAVVAYRMAGAQFLDDARDRINAFFQENFNRPPTEQEQEEAYQEILPLAQKFGAAEAGPEALGNLALGGAGKYIRRALGGKTGIVDMATNALGKVTGSKALLAGVGGALGEIGTEAVTKVEQDRIQKQFEEGTMKGQSPDAVKMPARTLGDYAQAFTDVAPSTLALTGLMGAAGLAPTAISKGYQAIRPPTVATPPPVQPATATAQPDLTDVAANVAATDEGEVAPPGTPVTLDGQNFTISIPPGSSISPDAVAGFHDDPDTLRALADRGDIRLEQVIAPAETVDTTALNDNLAVSAALTPQVVTAMKEIAVEDAAPAENPVVEQPAASMPMMVTRDMRQQLSDLGYSKTEVSAMRPEEAAAVIASGVSKRPISQPAVTAATVPQEPVVSSAEIAPAGDPFAAPTTLNEANTPPPKTVTETPTTEGATSAPTARSGGGPQPTQPSPVVEQPSSEQTFVETPGKQWDWEVTDQLGGTAYGRLDKGVADIVGMESVPQGKKYSEEGDRLKRRGFFRSLVNTLKGKGAKRLKISMQSADTRKALARLVETGELTNPREMAGISVDEHPTLFDIPQPAPAQPVKPKRPKKAPAAREGVRTYTGSLDQVFAEEPDPNTRNRILRSAVRKAQSDAELQEVLNRIQPQQESGNANDVANDVLVHPRASAETKERARALYEQAFRELEQPIEETPAAPLPGPLRPKFEAGETVTFKVNGQPVIGTIQRVSGGGNATVTYNWNGKKEQEIVLRTSEIQRPVLAVAEEPNYKYTQEQNTRKIARFGLPTEPGVTVNAGSVIKNALARIASDTAMPPMLRAVARALQKQSFEDVDLRIETDGRRKYAGQYLAKNGRDVPEIELNLRQVARGQLDAVSTLLHEALHHVTLAKIRNPQGEIETQAVEALDTLRKRIKAYAGMQQKATKFSYELGTVDEFITALFTRPDFQDFIAGIPDTFVPGTPGSKFRSVLAEVFRIIAQLVTGQKVQKGGMLDQAFASSLALFETPQRAARGQSVDYAPASRDVARHAELEAKHNAGTITPEETAEAQALVDAAAKAAGFDSPKVFHGSPRTEGFTVFDPTKGKSFGGVNNVGSWWTTNPAQAESFAEFYDVDSDGRVLGTKRGNVYQAYLNLGRVWEAGSLDNFFRVALGRSGKTQLADIGPTEVATIREYFRNSNVDSVRIADTTGDAMTEEGGGEYYLTLNPSQIKSADPFTGVPLDERFQPTSPDIRFSTTDDTTSAEPVFTPDEARAILTKRFGKAVADKIVWGPMAKREMSDGEERDLSAELVNGEVFLNSNIIQSGEQMIAQVEHEIAHAVFEDAEVQDAWKQLRSAMPLDTRMRLRKLVRELGYEVSRWDEEATVRFLEEVRASVPPSEWRRFLNAVANAIRRLLRLPENLGIQNSDLARAAAARIIAAGEAAVARGLDPGKQAFGQSIATPRDTVPSRKYPGTINLEAAISYAEQVKMAQEAIAKYKKASESKDKIQVLADAREAILLDRDIRTSTKAIAFDLLAQQGSILANLAQAESRSQIALDDFANLTATATGVLESDPAGFADFKFTTTDELAKMASEFGRSLNALKAVARLTPDGFLRIQERIRQKKVNAATEQQFGTQNVMSEIEKLWTMMQEAGATNRGLAIAAALKAFMPSRKNAAALIAKLFPQAGVRDRMTKGGEALVRDFFQMMAGPRDPKGPLAEFDESIQSALSSMLRKVMEARGLVADNQTVQATDIDKLVRSVSADPLRFDKIAAADAAMQDELAKIDDAERRATLQQAWEEATSKMYTNIANEATTRRAVNAELKAEGVNWNQMFDKGQKPAALRAKVVDAVMAKVGALVTGQTDPTAEVAELEKRLEAETDAQKQKQLREQIVDVRAQANALKNNLASLRSEVGAAFDFIAETKRVQWLAYRAGIEARRRVAERRKDMLAALRNRGVAESALMRLNEKMAGPQRPGAEPNPVSTLIGEHIKTPVDGFIDKLVALGVDQPTAEALDAISGTVRADLAKLAEANAVKRLTESLKPKTRAAKSAIPRLLRVLLEAGKTGAFDSKAFNDALGEAFDFPPMTAEQEAEIKRMVTEINKLPQGAARVDKQQELQNYVALVQGVPARDMLLSAWYANILSGVSTQLIGLVGNSVNTILRSTFLALTSPADFRSYLRGALGVGADAGLAEVKAALKGRGMFKVGRLDSPEIANALEVLFRKGPTTPAEWVAYIASAGTRLRMVFRLMGAIDAFFWNSAREGMYHLAASRTVRKMAKDTGMTAEEANAEFIRQLGGGPDAYEAALKDAEAALTRAGQPADMATMDRMAREAIDKARAEVNPEAVAAANRWADRMVLQQEPEGVGKIISSLIKAVQGVNIAGFPLGQMLVPFNKIVSNLFEQSLDYTGLGLVRSALGMHISDARIDWSRKGIPGIAPAQGAKVFDEVERRERAMAGFVGLTLSAAAYVAAKANMDDDDDEVPFMLYAFGPTDKNKREQMPDGWVPFSIKIGNNYYRYAEWPLGMVLAGFAAALDAERYGNMKEKDTMSRIGYSAMLGLKGFMTQGVLSSVDTAIDVLMFKASGKKYTDIPVNAAKGLIPAQGFLRDISSIFDNTKVSNDDITAALLKDIPFVKSLGTKPELNVFGEPTLMEGEAIARRFVTQRRPHPAADYLTRNKLYIPGMDETVTIGQYLPPTERDRFKRRAMQMEAMENGVFTPEQNYAFRKRAGELTKAAVERIMKQAPAVRTDEQRKVVQNLIDKQVGLARRRAMVEAVPYEAPR